MFYILILFFVFNGMLISLNLKTYKSKKFLLSKYQLNMKCEVYCPDPNRPRPSSLHFHEFSDGIIPKSYPPLIYHIIATKQWNNMKELILSETDLDENYLEELIRFGSVYIGDSSFKAKRIDEKDFKASKLVEIDTYCRIHANPRRYHGSYGLDWSRRVAFMTDLHDLLIVNKPFDCPIAPTVDNIHESLVYNVQQYYKKAYPHFRFPDEYYVSSRLDACTSGLTPLAASSAMASLLGKEIMSRSVRKIYKVLCKSPTPVVVGNVRHCFRRKNQNNGNGKPTLLREYDDSLLLERAVPNDPASGYIWQLAELNIVSSRKLSDEDLNLTLLANYENTRTFNSSIAQSTQEKYFYECEVELITGRTHQIRLQFAALNAVIIGDTRYENVGGLLDSDNEEWKDGSELFGPEPKIIGLQCHQLTFNKSFIEKAKVNSDIVIHDGNTIQRKLEENGDLTFTCPQAWWKKTS